MSETLKWSYQTTGVGGPTLSAKGEMQVDAYMKLNVTLPANSQQQAVEILTGDEGGALQFLIINPKAPSNNLSYTAGDGPAVVLDGPHVLIGSGAVSLLAATVGTLTFTNNDSEVAEISILAGRDATPTP